MGLKVLVSVRPQPATRRWWSEGLSSSGGGKQMGRMKSARGLGFVNHVVVVGRR